MAFSITNLFSGLTSFLGPLGKIWDHLKEVYNHSINIYANAQALVQSVIDEIDGWKNFKQDIRLKQRVVQIESAIQKTRDLVEGIPAAWRSIVDLVKQFKGQLGESNPVEETEALTEDLESGGFKALLEKFPALGKALEKVLGFLAILVSALQAISDSIDDLQKIVDELKGLRLEFEKLDTIFLSQSNKRKTLRLEDGSSIRVRIGKLHPSCISLDSSYIV